MSGRRIYIAVALIRATWPALAFAVAGETRPSEAVVADGPVKLTVCVDRNVAGVADPIQLVLEVDAPRGSRVELPTLSSQLGDFELRGSERLNDIPTGNNGEVRRWVLKAKLETIKTGDHTIPPLDVRYAIGDKSTTFKSLSSKSLPIHITSVLENHADLRKFHDIKDAIDVAVPELSSHAWIAWSTVGAGILFAGVAIVIAVATRRRRGPSPANWALAAIADIQQLPIANAADAEAVYNEIVDIIRGFFEIEFDVRILSRTTREFLTESTNEIGLGDMPQKRLTWLVGLADDVKFARRGIGTQQVHHALQQARLFIAECEQHRQATSREAA
jgi:hypothetical protein